MSTMTITTTTDAETFVNNSGVADWDWGELASAEGFAEWLFRNRSEVDTRNYHGELREYLVSVGEDPADYDL